MKKEFSYKELDQEGEETLSAIAEAGNFNEWMFETIRPFCKGEILEIGSGIGNISEFFIDRSLPITLSDIRESYCTHLVEKFPGLAENRILQLDIAHKDFDEVYADYLGKFDSVFALNVIEHIEYDNVAVQNCRKLLKPGGNLIILVPAFQSLYNRFDRELEHYRRYTQKTISRVLASQEFDIIHRQYWNSLGIPGWYVSGKLQNNKTIPKGQMKIFNYMVLISKMLDRLLLRKIGLSVIVVGQKPDN